jgi:hypothetical protein
VRTSRREPTLSWTALIGHEAGLRTSETPVVDGRAWKTSGVLHDVYLPFKEDQLRLHFAPVTGAEDLPHRREDWSSVARRIGWATFEDCRQIEPAACRWLKAPSVADQIE